MKKLIIIIGTTSSSKTALAIKLAKDLNGEIINADAFQVYKEISIGTAKTTDTQGTKYYLNGTVSIYDEWNIKRFQTEAARAIEEIYTNGKTPIIVGGSNLYIDSLIYNYDLSASGRTSKYDDWENEKLFNKLLKIDPEQAQKIGVGNKKRLIRAIEVLDEGKSLTNKNDKQYDFITICASKTREEVYERINEAVDEFIKNGWVQEVEELYKKDKNIGTLNAFKAIGYQEILDSITNNKTLDLSKIKQKTRNYAKRQLTWIRHHYNDLIIFDQNNYDEVRKTSQIFLDRK